MGELAADAELPVSIALVSEYCPVLAGSLRTKPPAGISSGGLDHCCPLCPLVLG